MGNTLETNKHRGSIDMEAVLAIVAVGYTLAGGILMFVLKQMNAKIRILEENCYSEKNVRQLIDDKIGGIHQDLRDIKTKIDKLFDLYIENKTR